MVVVRNGIGYSATSRAAFYTEQSQDGDGGKFSTGKDIIQLNAATPWRFWGPDNMQPSRVVDDIQKIPALSAAVETSSRLSLGKGLDAYLLMNKDKDGTETLEWVGDAEISDWMELNDTYMHGYSNVYNMLGHGLGNSQLMLSRNRQKINRIRATDIYTARLEKEDTTTGLINNIYLCGDWRRAGMTYDANKMRKVPVLEEGNELQDLQQRTDGYEFSMMHRLLKNGLLYYPVPLHASADNWKKVTRAVPEWKIFAQNNQMSIKYLVIISENYWKRIYGDEWDNWAAEKRIPLIEKKYDEISNYLTGQENAGKSITAGKYYDKYAEAFVNDIEIQVIDDKTKDGKMLPDSSAGDKQILLSCFSNPAIFGSNLLGDGASGGAGSGSDIREATMVLLMLLHPERENNLRLFNLVKKYNGWSDRLEVARDVFAVTAPANQGTTTKKVTPRLVFRYSSSVLTTLDTGKSTQPVNN